jgi:ubiquinone/menaquinone biosynthesis C-methylase UbiE
MILDRRDVISELDSMKNVVLEFGCGQNKVYPEAIAIDSLDFPCVDIVGDAIEVLRAFPDSSVVKITSSHFLEHLADVRLFLEESQRVLVCGGIFEATVPHFSNPYYYSDPTHKTPFGLYTFSYLTNDQILKRRVPAYGRLSFELVDCRLIFRSYSKSNIRHWLKQIFTIVFNASTYLKEFYEENLCFILPCYEIHVLLKKIA